MKYDYLTINFFPIIGIIFLMTFLWKNSSMEKNVKYTFYGLCALTYIELAIYNFELFLTGMENTSSILTAVTALGYSIRPLMLYLFVIIVIRHDKRKRIKVPLLIPALVNIVFAFSTFFTHASYYYDEHNILHRGSFGWTPHIVMITYLIVMILLSYSKLENKNRFERLIILETSTLITFSSFAESIFENYFLLRISITASLIFYFMFFQSKTYKDEIIEKHVEQTKMTEKFTLQMVTALAGTVDAKDSYTNGHSQRVAIYAREIARRMNKSKEFQREIYFMGMLHDIGKIGVPDSIINKAGKLTDDEFDAIKMHPVIGAEVLKKITEMPSLYVGARWHHERYDGKGYPDGLKGDEIPFEARVIAVADAYDAMTSNRSYRKSLSQETVRAELKRAKRTQLDPYIVNIMLEMMDEDVSFEMREK